MQSEFERNLEKYAEVIVKVGLNIQPGQRLVIGPPLYGSPGTELETAPLVRLIAMKAYQAGAKIVDVMWSDDHLDLIRFQHAPRDSFEEFPTWKVREAIEAAKAGDALLMIVSPNYGLFDGQDPALLDQSFNVLTKHMKPFLDLRGKLAMNFSIVAGPVKRWADKVFPDLPEEKRTFQLWDAVFEVCRVKHPDPVSSWKEHNAELQTWRDYLNSRQYNGLHMTASGTDLRLGLPDGHLWIAGSMTTQSGINFIANIPTEEVFTLPHKDKVDGFVKLTWPLDIEMGSIDGLTLTFSSGKVVKATAEQGDVDILHNWLEIDETFNQLGEVALVPHSSPISQSGQQFHNLLFDENASSHLALGNAYRFCIEGGEKMSDDEFIKAGGNISQDHFDFMIGSENMDVDGITDDGSNEPIMHGGEWAFDI